MQAKIGVMQGRLSPAINNRIQQFPWDSWQNEFMIASKNGIKIIEWTIDSFNFSRNPIITPKLWKEINNSASTNNVSIPSVTCDYFMENPPWKSDLAQLRKGLSLIFEGMKKIGSRILVIPLVDNSTLFDARSAQTVESLFKDLFPEIVENNLQIAFESDQGPKKLKNFIDSFEENYFGINYDIGNSASLGFTPSEEFETYGTRIINVHIKDRILSGPSVPLGEGNADFIGIFRLLQAQHYQGNLILQTARSSTGNDVEVLVKYKKLVQVWWEEAKIE